ncbi:MAG TPA: hypothetical protein VFG10_15320 [Saprospiraceae bacterium]|nr:hypothetical protein [Saprospiraceae bacterium]
MKKLIIPMMTTCLLLSFMPISLQAATHPDAITTSNSEVIENKEANALLTRLYEIKAMDVKQMNHAEKKQLRKEVKAIKSELKAVTGGVYLSAGAIIIIVLLLLLLL